MFMKSLASFCKLHVCLLSLFFPLTTCQNEPKFTCPSERFAGALISMTEMALKGHVSKTLEKITFTQCSLRCLREDWCVSVNFEIQKTMGKCELNDYGVEDETSVSIEKGEFEKKEGFVYTQLRPAGSGCHDNTCKNGGTCVVECNKWQPQCSCPRGFRGKRCEDISECSSNPCLHGGTCTDQVNGYSCTCAAGYNGANCENSLNCEVYFPSSLSLFNAIVIRSALPADLDTLTVSFWMKVSDQRAILYPFSYVSLSVISALIIGIKDDGMAEVTVAGETKVLFSGVKRDNKWQHCAVTWKSSTGNVSFYRDNKLKGSETGLKIGEKVPSGGILVIGQYQGSYGGGYDSSKLMIGYLADLNIWSRELTSCEIKTLSSKCFSSSSSAPVLPWSTIISKPLGGELSKTCPATCSI